MSARGSLCASRNAETAQREVDVLAVIDHLALGGAEMLLGQFAAAAPRAGIRLRVACLEDGDGNPAAAPLRAAGVEPVNLGVSGRPGRLHVRAVREHIRAVSPDIVHTHLGTADLVGGVAARSLGVPAVSTIHAIKQPRTGRGRIGDALLTLSQRCCAARVIVVSDSARVAYVQSTHGMDRRVVRIYNGIDFVTAPGGGAAIRAEFGIAPDDLLVGMVSALRPEKGHDIAIAAIEQLRTRFPRLRLLIAGQGPTGEEIARRAAPLGDAVTLAGSRTDVASVFDALDVCLHPSRLDAFPTTLIEALAASTPIVASAVGGIPEIIENDVTGMLVPAPPSVEQITQRLGDLLDDGDRRRRMAVAGRSSYLERFTAGPWVQHTRELYDEVLDERRLRRTRRDRGLPA
jgi:glycosyltransferase involved in cell wall biosynthesis